MGWKESARAIRWKVEPLVDGEYRPSAAGAPFNKVNPATEALLYETSVGSSADVDEAVWIARKRFDEGCWSKLPTGRRAEILVRFAELITRHSSALALLDTLEMGKPIRDAVEDAEVFAPMMLRSWAGFADKLVGSSAPLISGTLSFNAYGPRGVIGAITAWNFPGRVEQWRGDNRGEACLFPALSVAGAQVAAP